MIKFEKTLTQYCGGEKSQAVFSTCGKYEISRVSGFEGNQWAVYVNRHPASDKRFLTLRDAKNFVKNLETK